MKKIIFCCLFILNSLNASSISLQCVTVYSILSPTMYKNKNYEIAHKIDVAAKNNMNVLKEYYSNEELYDLLVKENKKIFSLMNNAKNKKKFNKLVDKCLSKDNIK